MAYRITTDSTVDLTPERMQELGVPFAMLHVLLDGKDLPDDMKESSALYIYNAMREGHAPTTAQATVESFLEIWEPILKAQDDVLYIAFPSVLSGTINSALVAKEQLLERYPERRIEIVDSACASSGEGMLLELAVRLKNSGLGFDECLRAVEKLKLRIHHWFTVDDLVYLRRGGRISGAAATIATLLSIKPILTVTPEGRLVSHDKIKGRRAAIKKLVKLLEENINLEDTPFVNICHADSRVEAQQLMELITERFPGMDVRIYSVGAVIGAHAGPGTLAVFFVGPERKN
ncbi:MAG TPA: DegV family protein [Clostridia bacterium]|nr:DegV family protein [Clostridia bacterium]